MKDLDFYILGPRVGDELTYWNLDKGWVTDFGDASAFPKEILTLPLPEGATTVMPFSSASEPMSQFNLLPGGGVGVVNFFQKVY